MNAATDVVIIDRIGLLVYCYGIAAVAFIGGSLVDCGGHNPLEAILAGAVTLSGPCQGNFSQVYAQLQQAGASLQAQSSDELCALLVNTFDDAAGREKINAAAKQVIADNRGALGAVLVALSSRD